MRFAQKKPKLGKTPASCRERPAARWCLSTSRSWQRHVRHLSKSGTAPRLVTTPLLPVRDLPASSRSVCQRPASSFPSAATYSSHSRSRPTTTNTIYTNHNTRRSYFHERGDLPGSHIIAFRVLLLLLLLLPPPLGLRIQKYAPTEH
jgi:hypothetical protein